MNWIPEVHGALQVRIVERFSNHDSWAGQLTGLLSYIYENPSCIAKSVVHNNAVPCSIAHVPSSLPYEVILLFECPPT